MIAGCTTSDGGATTGSGDAKETGGDATTGTVGAATTGTSGAPEGTGMAAVDFEKDLKPALTTYCTPCHAGTEPKKGIDVTKLTAADKDKFGKIASEIEGGKMPPKDAKQPSEDEKKKVVDGLKALAG
jgi:hypothetical protein